MVALDVSRERSSVRSGKMRRLLVVSFLAMAAVAVAGVQDKKPINAKCPVKGEPVNANITADYEGKVVGFC